MNWELADRVKGRLKPGLRVYAYSRIKGKRKKVDSYAVTRDQSLIAAEFESFIQELEPHEVEVRDSNGYVTSCRLTCEREDKEESWTDDIDGEQIAAVLAILDQPNQTPKQIGAQLLALLNKPGKEA